MCTPSKGNVRCWNTQEIYDRCGTESPGGVKTRSSWRASLAELVTLRDRVNGTEFGVSQQCSPPSLRLLGNSSSLALFPRCFCSHFFNLYNYVTSATELLEEVVQIHQRNVYFGVFVFKSLSCSSSPTALAFPPL